MLSWQLSSKIKSLKDEMLALQFETQTDNELYFDSELGIIRSAIERINN